MATLPLGQSTQYPDQYDPSLLFPIPRAENRKKLGLKEGQTVRNKKTGQLAIIRNGVPVPIPQTPAATEQPATADETDEEEP